MTQVSKNYKFTSQLSKLQIYGRLSKIPDLISQSYRNFKSTLKPTYYLQNYQKSVPLDARKFQTYQSTLIDPRNPNLPSISSKTSPIALDCRLKFWTKMPFVKNSSKNRFATSYHVLHTLPIKTP